MGGGQKQIASLYINNSGSNKILNNAYANINGTSKEIFEKIPYHSFYKYKLEVASDQLWTLNHISMSQWHPDRYLYLYTSNSGSENTSAQFLTFTSYTFSSISKQIEPSNNLKTVSYSTLKNDTTAYGYAILKGGRDGTNDNIIDWSSTNAPKNPTNTHNAWYLLFLHHDDNGAYVTDKYDYFEQKLDGNESFYYWNYNYNDLILTQNKDDYTESSNSVINSNYTYYTNIYDSSTMVAEYVYKYNGVIYK